MSRHIEPSTVQHKRDSSETPLVRASVTVRARAADIFAAWENEELLKQWWGPDNFGCPSAVLDFKKGGAYHIALKNVNDGSEFWSTGLYVQIIPNRIIVCEDYPASREGAILEERVRAEGPFADRGPAYITLELEEMGDPETKITLSHEGLPARMQNACIEGWTQALNKLKQLVEKH